MIKFNSTPLIMLGVSFATLPGVIQTSLSHGFIIPIQIIFCILACLLLEAICLKISKKNIMQITNFTWLVTGILLAISIPLGAKFIFCFAAAFIAIVLIKFGAGGTGKNVLNPAMAGLGFLAICFYNQIHTTGAAFPVTSNMSFPQALTYFFSLEDATVIDAIITATPLNLQAGSKLLINFSSVGFILGGIFLAWKNLIRPEIPFFIITSCLLVDIFCGHSIHDALIRLSFGGLIFAAFFIATDPVTSPITVYGRIIYAIVIGTITALSRNNGLYPDGIIFGVLAANLMVPHLDQFIWKHIKT